MKTERTRWVFLSCRISHLWASELSAAHLGGLKLNHAVPRGWRTFSPGTFYAGKSHLLTSPQKGKT